MQKLNPERNPGNSEADFRTWGQAHAALKNLSVVFLLGIRIVSCFLNHFILVVWATNQNSEMFLILQCPGTLIFLKPITISGNWFSIRTREQKIFLHYGLPWIGMNFTKLFINRKGCDNVQDFDKPYSICWSNMLSLVKEKHPTAVTLSKSTSSSK